MYFGLIVTILLFAFFLSQNKISQSWKITSFLTLMLSLIIAFREMKVPDTEGYVEEFLMDADLLNFDNSPYEKGYTLFMRIFHLIFGDCYQVFLALFPLLNFFLLSKSCKIICETISTTGNNLSEKRIFPFDIFTLFFVYFSYYGLYHNAIVLRAGVATTLIIVSLSYYLRNRYKRDIVRSIVFFILALLFHTSVLVCLPMYWLIRRNYSLSRGHNKLLLFYILLLFCIFAVYLLSPYLGIIMNPLNQLFLIMGNSNHSEISKFEFYSGSSMFDDSGISFKFLFFYIFGWIFTFNKYRNEVWNKLLLIYLFGLCIWAIFRPVLWVERITDFYTFFYVILAMIYYTQNKCNQLAKVLMLFTGFLQFVFIYRIITMSGL